MPPSVPLNVAFAIENIWIRTEVYTHVSAPKTLTLWAGTIHQWPVYHPFLIAAYCMGYAWLRDSQFAAVTTLVGDQLPWSWMSMQGERSSVPELPSYLAPGMVCGQPGQPLCASQYLDTLQHDPGSLPRSAG